MARQVQVGLDTVEFVMAVEELYQLSIPDRDAEKIRSVGELCDYLCTALRQRGDESVAAKLSSQPFATF